LLENIDALFNAYIANISTFIIANNTDISRDQESEDLDEEEAFDDFMSLASKKKNSSATTKKSTKSAPAAPASKESIAKELAALGVNPGIGKASPELLEAILALVSVAE
jgi:DNA repair exonuclease SbcCD nuclease subunit